MLPTLAVLAALIASDPEPDPEPPPPDASDTPTETAPEVEPEPTPEVRPEPTPRVVRKNDFNAPWRQGRSRLSINGGLVGFGGDASNDFFFGGSYGYFIVDNLELGIDALFIFGDSPFTLRAGPSLLYIVPLQAAAQPYFGGFYRHWFVADSAFLDADTVGGRAGVVVRTSGMFLQIGLVVEGTISECTQDCTSFYPELGFSLSL